MVRVRESCSALLYVINDTRKHLHDKKYIEMTKKNLENVYIPRFEQLIEQHKVT